jgi:rod shape-determining protein MreD
MRNSIVLYVFFALFLLEGTVFPWLIPYQVDRYMTIVANPLLIMTVFVGVHVHRHKALIYGFSFGLLKDVIFYGHVIGIYTFSTAIIGYFSGLVFRHFHQTFVLSIVAVALGNLGYEIIVYGLYRLLNIVDVDWKWALFHQFLPTVMFNTLLAVFLYLPVHRFLLRNHQETDEDNSKKFMSP